MKTATAQNTRAASDTGSLATSSKQGRAHNRAGQCVACRRSKTRCRQRIPVLGGHLVGGMAGYLGVRESHVAPFARLKQRRLFGASACLAEADDPG